MKVAFKVIVVFPNGLYSFETDLRLFMEKIAKRVAELRDSKRLSECRIRITALATLFRGCPKSRGSQQSRPCAPIRLAATRRAPAAQAQRGAAPVLRPLTWQMDLTGSYVSSSFELYLYYF